MTIQIRKFESKPDPYEVIYVDENKLDDIASYLGADRIEFTKILSGHPDTRVYFVKKNDIRIGARLGHYLARKTEGDDQMWNSWDARSIEKHLVPKDTPDIYPPYDN